MASWGNDVSLHMFVAKNLPSGSCSVEGSYEIEDAEPGLLNQVPTVGIDIIGLIEAHYRRRLRTLGPVWGRLPANVPPLRASCSPSHSIWWC